MTKKQSLFLLICSMILALVIGELFLRIITKTSLVPDFKGTYTFDCYTKGTTFWLALKPNTTCLLHSEQHAFPDEQINTNMFGFRNPEIQIPKPAGTKRILIVGDSFTFGMGVTEQETYPRLIEKFLGNQAPANIKVEVINAGLPTAGINYYYLLLKNMAKTLDPDIILIGYYPYNDTHDEEIKPVWTSVDANGLPITVDSTTAYIDGKGTMYSKSIPLFMRFPILRNSRIIQLINRVYIALTKKNIQKMSLIPTEMCIFEPSCHAFDADKTRIKKMFTAMKDLDGVHGKPFFVMFIPAEFQVYDQARYKFNIPVALTPGEKQFPHQELATMLTSLDIPSFNLLPVFTTHKTPVTYFEKDIHWNEEGHKIAAETLAPMLLPYLTP